MNRKNILIYIQQNATLHRLFIPGNCSTCFGWYFHPSSEAQTTVTTASGICRSVTAACCYRARVGTGSNCPTIAAGSNNGKTNTRCCSYSCLRFWWWVVISCHSVTATCRYRGRGGTGFNSSTIAAGSNNGITNTRSCSYSCLRSWWWVVIPPDTTRNIQISFQIK